jgi:hypothetical protein
MLRSVAHGDEHGNEFEREFKYRIPDEERFQALVKRLGGAGARPVTQRNHFFDTRRASLRAHEFALRLREEDGRCTLTLKGPARGPVAAVTAREEVERAVGAAEAHAIRAGARDPLEALGRAGGDGPLHARALAFLGGQQLVAQGSFENERTRIGPSALPGVTSLLLFELDRTRFPDGRVDFELEVEIGPEEDSTRVAAALEALLRILDACGPGPARPTEHQGPVRE